MKKYFVIFFLTALGVRAEMEFSGFFLTSNEALFSITDTESKRSSGWLKIGQSFGDYTVVSFDREHEVIRLKHGDQSLELPLRGSKVKDGKMTISGVIVLGPNDQSGWPNDYESKFLRTSRLAGCTHHQVKGNEPKL